MLDARILDVLVQWRRRTPGVPTCNIAAPVVFTCETKRSANWEHLVPAPEWWTVREHDTRGTQNAGGTNPAAAASLLMRFQTPEGENEQERKETSEESDETSVPSACGQSEEQGPRVWLQTREPERQKSGKGREKARRGRRQRVLHPRPSPWQRPDRNSEMVPFFFSFALRNPSRRNLAVTTFPGHRPHPATHLLASSRTLGSAREWNGKLDSFCATSYPCPPTPFTLLLPVSSPADHPARRRAPLQPRIPAETPRCSPGFPPSVQPTTMDNVSHSRLRQCGAPIRRIQRIKRIQRVKVGGRRRRAGGGVIRVGDNASDAGQQTSHVQRVKPWLGPTSFTVPGLTNARSSTNFNNLLFTTPPLSDGFHNITVVYDGDSEHTPLPVKIWYITNTTVGNALVQAPPLNITVSNSLAQASSSAATSTPATTSQTTGTPSPSSSRGVHRGAMVGGIIGGIFLVVVGLVVLFVLRRRRTVRASEEEAFLPTAFPAVRLTAGWVSWGASVLTSKLNRPPPAYPGPVILQHEDSGARAVGENPLGKRPLKTGLQTWFANRVFINRVAEEEIHGSESHFSTIFTFRGQWCLRRGSVNFHELQTGLSPTIGQLEHSTDSHQHD
ncbi:hypothetical protein FB45DRAFT_863206 [Roridomyces roridus]|uniref:Mid2 domain-containing protein n=1 Tax=Roridomyces roridus TaxID=1738132 RepID=A0AAD7C9M5_9AGAR|nr:hypothetical protein FB45DRAFT_863206 [Roridomyces roridus]